jgi:hypothetical protein
METFTGAKACKQLWINELQIFLIIFHGTDVPKAWKECCLLIETYQNIHH